MQLVQVKDALFVNDGNLTCRYYAQGAVIAHHAVNVNAGVQSPVHFKTEENGVINSA